MPYRSAARNKKYSARRKFKRGAKKSAKRSLVSFPIYNAPKMRRVRHKYVDRIKLDPDGTGIVLGKYKANGMFAVDTVTNHSPMGFDQMAGLFQTYYIENSTCTVQFQGSGVTGTNNSANIVAIYVSTTVPGPGNSVVQLVEQSKVRYRVLQSSVNNSITTLTERYNPHTIFGIKDTADSDDLNIAGDDDPVTVCYFFIVADSLFSADDSYPAYALVTIYFDAVWNNPQLIAQSDGTPP